MDNLSLDGFVNVDNNFIHFIIWIFILDFHLHLFPQTGMFRFTSSLCLSSVSKQFISNYSFWQSFCEICS